jgi:hypothetical protein
MHRLSLQFLKISLQIANCREEPRGDRLLLTPSSGRQSVSNACLKRTGDTLASKKPPPTDRSADAAGSAARDGGSLQGAASHNGQCDVTAGEVAIGVPAGSATVRSGPAPRNWMVPMTEPSP